MYYVFVEIVYFYFDFESANFYRRGLLHDAFIREPSFNIRRIVPWLFILHFVVNDQFIKLIIYLFSSYLYIINYNITGYLTLSSQSYQIFVRDVCISSYWIICKILIDNREDINNRSEKYAGICTMLKHLLSIVNNCMELRASNQIIVSVIFAY